MSSLRILALSYLAAASVFVVAAGLVTHPGMARAIAGGFARAARLVQDSVLTPALELAHRQGLPDREPGVVRLTLPPQAVAPPARLAPPDGRLQQPEFSASATITLLPDLTPDLSPEAAPVPPEPHLAAPEMPQTAMPQVAIARPAPPALPVIPPPLPEAPVATRADAAALRLKAALTPEMLGNFDLFLYVSKAASGPLGQRMLVFRKGGEGLELLHDWAVSTGREQNEVSPRGKTSFTATPRGFYELDPDRMYRRYRSWSWNQPMPWAMFFNWEREGQQTGLAIHAASGGDIARLGHRASAGCVHLAPENAALLYHLIRADYRGKVPRFAYNPATQTMSNKGNFAHDRDGNLRMTRGYRVLVVIEDYGGSDLVAIN
jgi:hypothetical protein